MPFSATGAVVSYDDEVGLGLLEASGGGGRYQFHCTQIAGGGRSIEAGTGVRFHVRPGRKGAWEAFEVTPVGEADRAELRLICDRLI